jgi:hypothetical protein
VSLLGFDPVDLMKFLLSCLVLSCHSLLGSFSSRALQTLVDVSEIQVLAVCKITECRGVEVSSFEAAGLLCLDLVATVVFGLHEHPEGDDDADFDEMAERGRYIVSNQFYVSFMMVGGEGGQISMMEN